MGANPDIQVIDSIIKQRLDEILPAKLEEALKAREENRTPSMTIIATKGTLDWAYPPFILSSTAAALGWDVSIFCTFYGLELLKKDISGLQVSPLGNPAMPMKMPFGPDWFKSIKWNIPNAIQSIIPGFEAFATTMMKMTIKNKGVAEIGELREPVPRGGRQDDRLPDDRRSVRLLARGFHPRSDGVRGRRVVPADGAGRGREPVHLTFSRQARQTPALR